MQQTNIKLKDKHDIDREQFSITNDSFILKYMINVLFGMEARMSRFLNKVVINRKYYNT